MAAPLPDPLIPAIPVTPTVGQPRRTRRWVLTPEIVIPAAVLIAIVGGCFPWPLVFPRAPAHGGGDAPCVRWCPGHPPRTGEAPPTPARRRSRPATSSAPTRSGTTSCP